MGRVFIYALACFLITASISTVYGQSLVLKGRVVDQSGAPLPGAGVVVKGTTTGVMTDQDGLFTLPVEAGQTLSISFLGFVVQEVVVSADQTWVEITLVEDSRFLDAVVITGALGIERAAREVSGGSQVINNATLNQG